MSKHGGNLRAASERFNIPENDIIDFSANINPLGLHPLIRSIIRDRIPSLVHYPDPDNISLKESLSRLYSVAKDNILPGNGSSELLYLLARILSPKQALIVQPNFSEYEASLLPIRCRINHIVGTELESFKVPVEKIITAAKKHDLVYLSSPNNPAGYTYSKAELEELLKQCKKQKSTLVIDEVFIDFISGGEKLSMAGRATQNSNLIVLRSLTKFYAIPGLRLGAVITGKALIKNMKSSITPWSVNTLAQAVGTSVTDDNTYRVKSIAAVDRERDYLIKEISKISSLRTFDSKANYILCKISGKARCRAIEEELGKSGILIRNCSNYRGLSDKFFRIAVRKRDENKKLVQLLKAFFDNNYM